MRLIRTYTKSQVTELLRTPAMFFSISLPPVLVLLFFIVPFIRDDSDLSTLAIASSCTLGVMLACLFHFGLSVSASRESSWGAYLRTLPGGLVPQVVSSILAGMVLVAAAVVPVVLVGALLTEATATPAQLLAAFGALLVVVAGFTIMGMAVGYVMSVRVNLVLLNILILPLVFGGGLFTDPDATPAFIEAISPYVPSRGASDLVRGALADYAPNPTALAVFGLWVVAMAALAVWGYRRDEGRCFR